MLIFLDTQTTGLEEKDRVCSIAMIIVEDSKSRAVYELVDEGKKIPSIASSIHNITDEMLKNKPKLQDSESYKFLLQHNEESTTIVGHNILFDMKMLQKSGFKFKGELIDTLRVTKHLIEECEIFSLAFLRYELRLYKKESSDMLDGTLHVEVVRNLYEYLLEMSTKEKLLELSFSKVLMSKFSFGKYGGRYIEEIAMCDRGYMEWMLSLVDLDEDLRYSIEYNLGSVL